MTAAGLIGLGLVFFLTAAISVVTGGTSLITVPVLLQCGIEPRVAVATNMLSLIFLSLGGTLPFLRGGHLPRERLPSLVSLTLAGSVLGAWLLVVTPAKAMPLVVALAMIAVAVFSLANRRAGVSPATAPPSRRMAALGYLLTLLLGVYGGFFSGGYVTLLTAAFVATFRMSFLEAVAVTKLLNLVSSLVATALFAVEGLVDWRLGFVLGAASFAGGLAGATLARGSSPVLLRRVFLSFVVVLAVKILLFDVRR